MRLKDGALASPFLQVEFNFRIQNLCVMEQFEEMQVRRRLPFDMNSSLEEAKEDTVPKKIGNHAFCK